jgi:hypothetical protein
MMRWLVSGALSSCLAVGAVALADAASIIRPDTAMQLGALFSLLMFLLLFLGKREAP